MQAKPITVDRHDLVWLNARGWQRAIAQASPDVVPQLWRWRERDWPVIVRTQEADCGADELDVGLVLPPDANGAMTRVPLRTLANGVAKRERALPLAEVLPSLPPAVADRLRPLTTGPTIQVAGLLALQALTGQAYVSEHTPVELIFRPTSRAGLEAGLAAMSQHANGLLGDIEIIFPSGQAVAWTEWRAIQSGRTHLLTKDGMTVRLMHVRAILTSLD